MVIRPNRARERGATLFVVVLVMTLLMGIGAFAARSAHLATTSSGHVRQQTQARFVSEYGIMIAAARLYGAPGKDLCDKVGTSVDATYFCAGQTATAMTERKCYMINNDQVQKTLLDPQNFTLCEPRSATYPGSLGMAQAECSFVVELTDKVQAAAPPGYDTSKNSFWDITATSTGHVRLVNAIAAAQSESTQVTRVHLLAGPYTN